ncbi:TBCC domain-containing protein 1-like protein [Carex littledalei]|uniref:TBCC domain-containing protein 1-like protein n=1 Tax=Carex littledalei TaxID=544730 RepID=A0A833QWG5_9POAL|nr:TBCC domain-containing protein 1-like protein [Carex littledalei]
MPQADISEAEPITVAPEVHNSSVVLTGVSPPGTKEHVLTDGNEAPDKNILRKLLVIGESNSRKFMPSQSGEESHHLSCMQKHMANILSLLSDALEGVETRHLLKGFRRLQWLNI